MENTKFDLAPVTYRPIGSTEALRLTEASLAEKIGDITKESLARLAAVAPERAAMVQEAQGETLKDALRLIKARDTSHEALNQAYQKHAEGAAAKGKTPKTREAWEAGVRGSEARKDARRSLVLAGSALAQTHQALTQTVAEIRAQARTDRRALSDRERAAIMALVHDAETLAVLGQAAEVRATA